MNENTNENNTDGNLLATATAADPWIQAVGCRLLGGAVGWWLVEACGSGDQKRMKTHCFFLQNGQKCVRGDPFCAPGTKNI